MLGGTTDESMIEQARGDCEQVISVLNGRVTGQDYFGGDSVSLADCHVLPVIHYIGQIPEGQTLLGKAPALTAWMDRMSTRDSVSSTVPSMG